MLTDTNVRGVYANAKSVNDYCIRAGQGCFASVPPAIDVTPLARCSCLRIIPIVSDQLFLRNKKGN